ncbi:CheR family methyltransferase [Aurantimonas sp. Leaf443]|uniref:CheR family methyltransferase n=1 Tax=Aurantimonas sp. Leaf443 TaxID=1736378 RepID=UPI0006FE3AFD|nr:CheR family methyltransferase [Aurantimonas sp. Leaf443]KQT86107.1 hypothetical protein ASG48_05875 [Aurantimonas sp. Leaf443]
MSNPARASQEDAIPHWTKVVLAERTFDEFVKLVNESCGVTLSKLKRTMLETRLRRRLNECDLPDFESYLNFLRSPNGRQSELQNFVDSVVTNETSFFRERFHFDYLSPAQVAQIAAEGTGASVRAWSAACSSGEEVWTLAMVLETAARAGNLSWSILGTDISIKVLQKAREAIYTRDQIATTPPAMARDFILGARDPQDDRVRIAPELRSRVSFGQVNLMHEAYKLKHQMDIIFLRNVLIYFEPATQEQVLAKLCKHLRPGGLLFLGHSDTTRSPKLPLRPIQNNIYIRT